MTFIKIHSILTGLFLVSMVFNVQAESNHHNHHDHGHHHHEHKEHTQHGAHEHGVATMQVAVMNGEVLVEIKSPLYNMLGFEHDAHNTVQQKLVEQQLQRISGAQLIKLDAAAQCQVKSQHTQHPFAGAHKHTQGHKQGHNHNHNAEAKAQHRDIQFEYHYVCQQPNAIRQLSAVNLFEAWPNLKTLRTEWVYQNQQSASQLTANAATVTFK